MNTKKMLLVLVASGLAFSGTAVAQEDNSHGLMNVRTTTVKPGKAPEYIELMGQLAAARKAAGHSGVSIYQVVRGPAGTFYSVSFGESYADIGEPFDSGMSDGDWQRWVGRVTDIIDHAVVTILQTHGELAITPESDSPPAMLQLRFSTMRAGTGADHHEWLAESLVPAFREGNAKGYNVSNVLMGDEVGTWVSSLRIDSWADLDGPGPLAHMSDRARDNLLEEYGKRVDSARVELVRFLPEVSY